VIHYNRYLKLYIALFFLLAIAGCTKIDTTTIGADLIPAVDNVNTFADTLQVNAQTFFFNDSTRLAGTANHIIGAITNDPLFGTTKADLFLELKPSFFPFFFGNPGDTVAPIINPPTNTSGFDSAVLCLNVLDAYGDSTKPHKFQVYKIETSNTNFNRDSAYLLNFQPDGMLTPVSDVVTFNPGTLRNFTYFFGSRKDSVNNQIRIRLSNDFLRQFILNLDTSAGGMGLKPFFSDSAYRTFMKGFAIRDLEETGSNSLYYIDINNARTRLEIHYKKRRNNVVDTSYSAFYFTNSSLPTVRACAHASNLKRDFSTGEILTSPAADAMYLQSTPGNYALLNIPALSTYSNRIIHRAELVVEQIPAVDAAADALNQFLVAPRALYLDLRDSVPEEKYKPIYFDLNPSAIYNPDNPNFFFPNGGIDFGYHGGFARFKLDAVSGKGIYYYNFNISRYIQNMVTRAGFNYTLRLSAPSTLNYYGLQLPFNNRLANGRVKLGNGNNTNYRLRLRVIYSKI
jgi:hypothetical protein